jgi:hypothetical protein
LAAHVNIIGKRSGLSVHDSRRSASPPAPSFTVVEVNADLLAFIKEAIIAIRGGLQAWST